MLLTSNQIIFAYVAFPVQSEFLLFIPFSDVLKVQLTVLRHQNWKDKKEIESQELDGAMALPTNLNNLSSYFTLSERSFENLHTDIIKEKGGGYAVEKFNKPEALKHTLNPRYNYKVMFGKNGSIRFSFKSMDGTEYSTENLTMSGFNKLILETYQIHYDHNS